MSSNFTGKGCCIYEIIPDENINVIDMENYGEVGEYEVVIERNVTLTLKEKYSRI